MPRLQRADWLAASALLLLDLSAYGSLLRPDRMLADFDALVYFYPLRAYAAAAVQEGRLPLWNPSSFLGTPFLANPQTAVFYPPTALFLWLPVPQAYGLSLVLHVLLTGLFFFAFCRMTLGTSTLAGLLGGSAFMLGGVISGQYGHLNQISAVAWLPLVLLLADRAVAHRSGRLAAAGGAVLGLQFLAGHPQQSYMTLVAAGLVCICRGWTMGGRSGLPRAALCIVVVTVLGAGLAAVQLVPSAELARYSIRGGGLSYHEAIADSLWPWLLARALLPSFVNDLGSTEFLGYVGVVPLLLAVIAAGLAEPRRLAALLMMALLGLGLALGAANPAYPWLYSAVPGFSSFRVPSRWLLLYTVGVASLAAIGLDWLLRRPGRNLGRRDWLRLMLTCSVLGLAAAVAYFGGVRAPRWLQAAWLGLLALGLVLALGCASPRRRPVAVGVLLALVGLELWWAGADLAPRSPVPLEAYAQPRDSTMFIQSRLGPDRFLSIAAEEYELKETPDYRERYASLPEDTVTTFLVAAKRNEVLAPNMNLLYGIGDVDGYDGGLLPLRSFLSLARILVPADRLRSDGALISRLESLPSPAVMDLLNLRTVLAGRAKDVQEGGVDYDRSLLVSLRPGQRLQLQRVPRRVFTSVGLISALEGETPNDGQEVAQLELSGEDGSVTTVPVHSGRETASSHRWAAPPPDGLKLLHPWSWSGPDDPVEYLAQVALPSVRLAGLAIVNRTSASVLNLRALTLIDERDWAYTPLVLDDTIDRAGFFDLKVYEYAGVLGRAYLVHQATEADETAGLALLSQPDHRPRERAVVEPGAGLRLQSNDGSTDALQTYEARAERVHLRARSGTNALLVLSDAFYPGWSVTVDGRPEKVIRTNIALRGVALEAGEHDVIFSYEPVSLRLGALISCLALLLAAGLLVGRLPGRARGMMRGRGGRDG